MSDLGVADNGTTARSSIVSCYAPSRLALPDAPGIAPEDGAFGIIATRRFVVEDQQNFAWMSGDTNPIHMDPTAARRTVAGEPVVHGIHTLLWVLENLAITGLPLHAVNNIKARFAKFIFLGRTISLQIKKYDAAAAHVVVLADGQQAVTITLRFGGRTHVCDPERAIAAVPANTLHVLHLDEMAGRTGWLSPPVGPSVFADAFPHAASALHPRRLSGLAQSSRLVGMVCPGLHSLYARLSLDLADELGTRDGIAFQTARVEERHRVVDLAIEGDGLIGEISAFARDATVDGPPLGESVRYERSAEFVAPPA